MGMTMHDDKQTASDGVAPSKKRLGRRGFLATTAAVVGSSAVTGGVNAAPYGGSAHPVPGRIEAENYDTGGQNWSYYDTSSGNTGGAYRSGDVDIETCSEGGYNVGWIEAGEWLTYTMNVESAGTYQVDLRVASGGGGGTVNVESDQTVLSTVDVPGTGGWQTWTTVSTTVELDSGQHVLGISTDTGGFNLNWIEFSSAGGGGGGGGSGTDPYPNLDGNSWNQTWSDEFDSGVDTGTWSYDIGNGQASGLDGWGNNELQSYQQDNVWTENSRLVIEARDETVSDQYGTYDYTSGKIKTQDKRLKQFGRIDVRAKLPRAGGVWPAIWMLGNDIDEATWPDCGEIDIMENFGNDWTTSHSTIHGPGYSGGGGISASYSGPDFTAGFHDYQLTWYQDTIKFWVDGNLVNTITADDVGSNTWAFNDDFYMILNVAIGGTLGATPTPSDYPARMEVDHVRYYDWA